MTTAFHFVDLKGNIFERTQKRSLSYLQCSCNYERAAGSDPTVCEDQKKSGLNRDKVEDETVFPLLSLLTRYDVSPEDFDESIPVGTRLFVEESQSVT